MSKPLHPRRGIVGGTHRVTDPYGRDEAPYKGAESYEYVLYPFFILNIFVILRFISKTS